MFAQGGHWAGQPSMTLPGASGSRPVLDQGLWETSMAQEERHRGADIGAGEGGPAFTSLFHNGPHLHVQSTLSATPNPWQP